MFPNLQVHLISAEHKLNLKKYETYYEMIDDEFKELDNKDNQISNIKQNEYFKRTAIDQISENSTNTNF